MSERTYYLVRPIVWGFELSFIVYGTKEELTEYLKKHFVETIYTCFPIQEDFVDILTNKLNFKVYMCTPISSTEHKENSQINKINKFKEGK